MTLIDIQIDLLADALREFETNRGWERVKDPIEQTRLVWRRAMMATLPELDRRGVDHGYNWKHSNVDPGLAIPYPPFWARRSTEELIDFYNFLIRSKPTKS